MSVTDSESEDSDPCNESLEPTFKKEDINRSRLIHQSLINDKSNSEQNDTIEEIHTDNDSVVEKSGDTLKDVDDTCDDDTANSAYETGDYQDSVINDTTKIEEHAEVTDTSKIEDDNYPKIDVHEVEAEINSNKADSLVRGTYFVKDMDTTNYIKEQEISKPQVRGTYFVKDTEIFNISNDSKINDPSLHSEVSITKDIIKDLAPPQEIVKPQVIGTYFVQDTEISNISNDSEIKKCSLYSEKSITKDIKSDLKPTEKTANKLFTLKSQNESDVSLAQFEQFEKDSLNDKDKKNTTEVFSNIKILNEKRIFFDGAENEHLKAKEKKTYFNNIDTNVCVNKQITELRSNKLLDDRSPSIVKEDVTNNFEPSTIKKLLGESFTRQPDAISSIHKSKILLKKDASVDIFEGFDSPFNVKTKENTSEPILNKPEEKENENKMNNSPNIIKDAIVTSTTEKLHILDKDMKEPKTVENIEENIIAEKIVTMTKVTTDAIEKRDNYHRTTQKQVEEVAKSPKDIKVDNPIDKLHVPELNIIEATRKSIEMLVLKQKFDTKKVTDIKIKTERPSIEQEPTETLSQRNSKENNTIDEFENIYKDITAPRATEFDLLISQEVSSSNITQNELEKTKNEQEKTKYNLRHHSIEKKDKVLLESHSKCESKPKRNLRLRRRKNQSEDEKSDDNVAKLKDIVNLQSEFSDVTLDVPAAKKDVRDIPSPENNADEENLPPLLGIQSCPSKR